MLEACDQEAACAGDMGVAAAMAYDRPYAQLLEGTLSAEFLLPDGTRASRSFSLTDLDLVATGQFYEEYDRMIFLRALAAQSGRGDLVPLLRLLNLNLGLDPQTQEVLVDTSWSDGMYYGVECLDYAYPGDTPEDVAQSMIESAPHTAGLRLASLYYGDLPCAFWPHTGTEDRPAPLTAEGIPVLVLGSTVDPVTPHNQGVDVHSRLDQGYIITKEGEVVGPYQPLFASGPTDDPQLLLDSVEREIYYLPEYYYWDGLTDTTAGCAAGGRLSFAATEVGDEYVFEDCGLSDGVVLSGTGAYHYDDDVFTLDVTIGACPYTYQRSGADPTVDSGC